MTWIAQLEAATVNAVNSLDDRVGYDFAMTGSAKTARQQRWRQRKRRGMRCVTIGLTEQEIDRLVAAKHLEQDRRTDQAAIQEAAEAFVSDAFDWL